MASFERPVFFFTKVAPRRCSQLPEGPPKAGRAPSSQVKMFSKHEDLLQLHQWPTWRRLASLRQALSEAIPSSGVEATSTQEGGACSNLDEVSSDFS